MAKKPANDFTHTLVSEANYFHSIPKQGDKPAGEFAAGTQVRLLNEKQGYAHVQSEDHDTGWVSRKYLEVIFRLTHETTVESPYWLKANGYPLNRPPDGRLPAMTRVLVHGVDDAGTGVPDRWAHVQWTKDGDIAFIDIQKTPLKPL